MIELPFPSFARIHRNTLILSQYRLSDLMSEALRRYLGQESDPGRFIQKLLVDDCGVTDAMFARILEGLDEQSPNLRSLVYANNDLGPKSIEKICDIMP
jgi:hypothetical protein